MQRRKYLLCELSLWIGPVPTDVGRHVENKIASPELPNPRFLFLRGDRGDNTLREDGVDSRSTSRPANQITMRVLGEVPPPQGRATCDGTESAPASSPPPSPRSGSTFSLSPSRRLRGRTLSLGGWREKREERGECLTGSLSCWGR